MNNRETVTQSNLLVQMGEEIYAINVSNVYQIFEVPPITKIPLTPAYMLGVVNDRGRLLPIIDLRIIYGVEASAYTKQTVIIATTCNFETESGGELQNIGLLVDAVHEVVDIDSSLIKQPTMLSNTDDNSWFSGFVCMGENIVMLLDIEKLLNSDSIMELKTFVPEKDMIKDTL